MNTHTQRNNERERDVRAVGLLGLPLGYLVWYFVGYRAVWLVGMPGPWLVGWLPLWLAGRLAG